jgi:hypothetical protein
MRARFALLAVLTSCTPKPQKAPEPEPLAVIATRALVAAVPSAKYVTKDASTIEATMGESKAILSLDNLRPACEVSRQDCDIVVAQMAKTFAGAVAADKGGNNAIDKARIRLTVKDEAWLATTRKQLDQVPAERRQQVALISRKLTGPLSIVYCADLPTGLLILRQGDLESLHLTLDGMGNGLWTNAGEDAYDSAMIAFPALWAPLAKTIGTPLWVTVPSRDRVFAANGKTGAVGLAAVTKMAFEKEDHRVSDVVLEWSPSGFTVAKASAVAH